MATAIALATVAVAGLFLGVRTTFTPSIGPTRLIFAFEAVIIGGLGSIWGTLAGGLVLGVAQALGVAALPRLGGARRPPGVPGRARLPAHRPARQEVPA